MDSQPRDRAFEILIVEDSVSDARLLREILYLIKPGLRLHHVIDGASALTLLRDRCDRGAPLPDIIFLDLNLPIFSGKEVLRKVKTDPVLRRTPVIILSTARDKMEIQECYDLDANCYVCKPLELDPFVRSIQGAIQVFLEVGVLPKARCSPFDEENRSALR